MSENERNNLIELAMQDNVFLPVEFGHWVEWDGGGSGEHNHDDIGEIVAATPWFGSVPGDGGRSRRVIIYRRSPVPEHKSTLFVGPGGVVTEMR